MQVKKIQRSIGHCSLKALSSDFLPDFNFQPVKFFSIIIIRTAGMGRKSFKAENFMKLKFLSLFKKNKKSTIPAVTHSYAKTSMKKLRAIRMPGCQARF